MLDPGVGALSHRFLQFRDAMHPGTGDFCVVPKS